MPRPTQSRQRSSRSSSRAASPPATAYPASAGKLPQSILQDSEKWSDFLRDVEIPALAQKLPQLRDMQEHLRELGAAVDDLGGWLEVTGRGLWPQVASDSERDAKADFEAFLFPIQKHMEFLQKYRTNNPFGVEVLALQPSCVVPIKVFRPPESGEITPEFWSEVFAEDVAILRGFVSPVWKFDHTPFTMDYLEQNHGDFAFDVLIQDRAPDSESMKLHSGTKRKCTVAEYVARMKSDIESGPGTGPVPFGVNLDIGAWTRQIDELQEKIPAWVNFGTAEDSLSHLRLHVNGMTLPQIYLKVAGCWTGAHQENLSFTAVNINHGPGACQWWALGPEHNADLREDIRRKLKFDSLKSETLWWPDENFLMSQGYKTYFGIQEPDDLVYVGPATLHWVKSYAATVNSAWNFGGKTIKQFEVAFSRQDLNREVGFESLVQVHTLALDLLNREMNSLAPELVRLLAEKLQKCFDEETALVRERNWPTVGVFPGHLVRRCEVCKLEILYAYAPCNACSCALCLRCAEKHSHPVAVVSEMFAPTAFARLMKRAEARCSGDAVDLFDPALNLHFTVGEKQRTAEAWTSPFRGAPSLIVFDPVETVVQAEKKAKRPRKDAEKSETKKKRKAHDGEVAPTLKQEAYGKPYTRSMAKSEVVDAEEVEEEYYPTRTPKHLLDSNAPMNAEAKADSPKAESPKTDSPKAEKLKETGPKSIETREITGTEVSLAVSEPKPENDGVYRIPKKVKPHRDL